MGISGTGPTGSSQAKNEERRLDSADNCSSLSNQAQVDTDHDGYGNLCDGDLNEDGTVGLPDFGMFKNTYGKSSGTTGYNPDADLDGDGVVAVPDFGYFKEKYGGTPGPSGLSCAGTPPCPAP